MSTLWLFVEPRDTLFFRDSRPFAAGETHSARSLEAPNPQTFYGMLRGQWYRQGLAPGHEAMGDLRVDFLAWARRTVQGGREIYLPYFPSPLNLAYMKAGEPPSGKLRFSCYLGEPASLPIATDRGHRPQWGWLRPQARDTALKAEEISGFFHPEHLRDWLSGSDALFREDLEELLPRAVLGFTQDGPRVPKVCQSDSLYQPEVRTGLGLQERRKLAREGLLYTMSMLRPQAGTGYLLRVGSSREALLSQLPGPALLGGWRKEVTLLPLEQDQVSHAGDFPLTPAEPCRYLIIYFYTLALFGKGHLPAWIDGDTREIRWPEDAGGLPSCRLAACYSHKPLSLSGWDLKEGRPKPLQRAVPAGAVWFLEKWDGTEFTAEQTRGLLTYLGNRTSLADQAASPRVTAAISPDQMGYGLFFAGLKP